MCVGLSRIYKVQLDPRERPNEGPGIVQGLAEVLGSHDGDDPFAGAEKPVQSHLSDRGVVALGYVCHHLKEGFMRFASQEIGFGKARLRNEGRLRDSRNGSSCITRITILTLEGRSGPPTRYLRHQAFAPPNPVF